MQKQIIDFQNIVFFDNDGSLINMGGVRAVGNINGVPCDNIIPNNPCEGFKQGLTLFKPVLLDEGNVNQNRIVQMNIAMCKK